MLRFNVYGVRDVVDASYGEVFISKNDGMAVRHVIDFFGKYKYFDKLELWRLGKTFDVDNGEFGDCEKCVVALPQVPSQPPVDEALQGAK